MSPAASTPSGCCRMRATRRSCPDVSSTAVTPARIDRSAAVLSTVQCAAVRMVRSLRIVPPQMNPSAVCSETCHGVLAIDMAPPPTMAPAWSAMLMAPNPKVTAKAATPARRMDRVIPKRLIMMVSP